MNQLEKKKRILLFTYPALIMAVLMISTYIVSEPLKVVKLGAYLFYYSIFLIFPLCFFTQGLLIRRYRENIGIADAISSISFLIVIFISFRVSALAYTIFYAVVELLGYGLYYLYEKVIKMKNKTK